MTDSNIITINTPPSGGIGNAPAADGAGLVCVFPSGYREGLVRMKAEKASALLCQA